MAQYLLQPRIEAIPLYLSPDDTSFLKTQMSSIEIEVTRLEIQISQLKCQLKKKKENLAFMYNILAPVRQLPFELLSNIFIEYYSLAIKRPRTIPSRKSLKPQLLLSQICSTWRQVAFGTPRLWCELRILLSPKGGISLPDIDTMMVDSWLARSGSLPLHILIAQWHPNSSLAPQNLLNRLVPFCNRLQSLCLALPLQCLLSFLGKQLAFPVLNKIDLTLFQNANKSEFSDVIPSFPQCRRFTTFLNALQLRTVKLNLSCSAYSNSSFLAQTVFMIPLPLKQLHSLHLELRDPGDYYSLADARSYFELLRNCQHTVVECRFVRCPAWLCDALLKVSGSMVFPALKVLCLEQWQEENEARFIQHITVPSLVTLRIDHSDYGGDDPSDSFSRHLIALHTRSSASLSTLELIRVRLMCTEDILSVLVVLPTLKHLKLNDCNLNTKLLMRGLHLCDSEGQTPIISKLESLHLVDFEVIPKGCENCIVDMVESRTVVNGDSRACFSTLTLAYRHHRITETMITRLNDLLLHLNLKAKY
ncbi:hypothetical protein C8J55DRAFT_558154 [Lentinula edodes]|uniref:F-box domain-containing protein n=1 Tax=Lentinula lateritia TaxID=40482 RepID=A0A9W9ARP5_9AGAR|nr:hypothetical protein C8J55DRAFT_558154 [Lentinula edodes]